MIGVLLRFQFGGSLNPATIQQIAGAAREKFVGLAGLRSKAFTYDRDNREAINFYLWESEAAAREFFTPAFVDRVAGVYGVQPAIQYLEVAELVENPPAAGG